VSELWKIAAARAAEFDAAALDYDRYRPRYPSELFDELVSLVEGRVATVVEIGAGTGIATAPLVARGLQVLAIEPSPAMAAILAEKSPTELEIAVNRFEDWEPDRVVDLVVAFNAWHWLDPNTAVDRVAHVMRPGGALALVWTQVTRYGPPALENAAGLHPDDHALDAVIATRLVVEKDDRFEPPVVLSHPFSRVLDAEAFVAVTHTYGGPHPPERDAMIRRAINEQCGGAVTKSESANAYVYRRI
jgi:SAM-dependent methyltransferase